MFARFRNLFSKNKNDSEVETEADVSCGMSDSYADDSLKSSEVNGTSEDSSKLEGLNLLKSIVESEQQGQNNGLVAGDKETSASLSEEVAELLKKRLSKGEEKLREDVNGLGESVRNESDIVEENGDHKEESEIICKNEEKLVDNEQVNENDVVPENGGPKKESENIQDSKEHENTEEISNKNEESTNLEQHYEENSSIESSEPTNKVEMENISAPDDNNKTTDELNSNEVKSDEKDSDENEKINKEENEQTFSEATDIEQVNGTNGEPIELHISENEEQKSSSESNDYALQNNVPEILVEKEKNEEVFEENGETKESALENNNEAPELSDEKKENISELCESEELKKSPESNELNLSEKVEDSEQKTSTETEDSSLTNDNKVAELSADKEIINETANIADLKKIQEENSEPKTSEETSPENNNDILEVSDEKKVNISELSNVENLNKTQEPNTQDKVENSEDKTLEETKDSSLENNAEVSELSKENETISPRPLENQVTLENTTSELHEPHENSSEIEPENPIVPTQTQESNAHNESNISDPLNIETNSQDSRDNSPELSDSSKSLSQSSVKEIHANSTSPTPSQDLETNNCNNSSIVVEDLPSEISTPTPTVDSTISIGSSNNSTLASSPVNEIHDPTKIIVNPIDNNGLACNAITNKLTDIAEVAESLDAVIREVQENVQEVEVESNPSPNDKKLGTLRSTSSEDWHSRSTEDDSFATASEGNFTPHSHSSASFLTASGRTSSYISCDKNSFDASEADDSTYNFEMPELTSPLNMSFEGSEQSYLSAQHLNGNLTSEEKDKTPTKLSENSSQTARQLEEDQSSIADIEDLHSESATPTPEDHYDAYHVESIPIESETELEVAGIANAPSLEIITEHTAMPLSKTPESTEKLYIKVVELEPKITTLGANLDESLRLQKDHDETLKNIQNLPGPMEEFVHKADKLLASKRISSELVNAMADTLNIIWADILHLLQDRQNILHFCTEFHDKMVQCQRRMDQLEVACIDTMIPIEVTAVQEFLNKFKQLRIDMLTAVMAALKDGNELLAQLQELENMESLDTRPEHIKRDATRSVHQVQQWLEALHDRRNALEIAWQTRKTQLEQCLALAMLGRELIEVEATLLQQRNEVTSMFSLGECEHTANNALHNYKEWKQQAMLLRDRALKITRAKEKLQASGTFTGDEACARAYNVLSACTEHLDLVDQREHWLQQSREFFSKADNTLKVLEKLEVELSNVKLPPNSPESFAMYAKVNRDVGNFTEEPLRLGYSILDEVGRTLPETQGIKRVLDEIENRKAYIEGICANSNEDQRRVQQALKEFLAQYNDLLEWLMSSGQQYLQQNIHMGRNLEQSKQFLLQHHELMQDLEIKGELINLLLESIKTHLESLSAQQRYDVDSKAESLHKHWIELKDLVLKRVDCVSVLIEFFEKANEFASQLDNLKRQLAQTPNEQKLQFLQETWQNIRNDFNDLKNLGNRFLHWKILDPYLDTKSSANAVEDILNGFSKQQIDVTTSLESWTTHIAEKREVETILEKIMSDNAETATKTTHVDTQLYPIFTSSSVDAKQLYATTQDKLKLVLQDIDQAQHEIQERVHTTLAIQTKDPESMQKIEQVISNLRTLKAKLDGIRYDYKTLVESVLQFLENVTKMRYEIDNYFLKQQQQYQQDSNDAIERCIAEHEKFRDLVMDKFRSLITQSELLIDRVRALEPPGAKEIDTDRILKLLENLRFYFESSNSERMSSLERLEKLEQFKNDILDINRSLDSVCKQLQEINNQSVDSLAAAKTTSLAFEYFERTIELLEKRIEKFTETTTQQLLISNPESEAYVREELRKLSDKWQQFKDQVKNKRKSLDQATDFFEIIEKIDAEYHEISYFYNSVSNKITYLRDPVEASNLVNDIDRYVNEREAPLREKLDSAAKCSHDMSKVSQLYNDVMTIFQSFMKLKSDITIVQERLKHEERVKEQREREAREQAEREKAAREAEARERAAREEEARLQALKEQAAREQFEREKMALELAARERAIREEEQRLMAAKEQAAREQAAREQAAREAEEARLRALREEEARLQAAREQAQREQYAREQAAREEEQARLKALREEEARLLALREQTIREEELRIQQLKEQHKREEEARQQAFRDQMKREEEARLQAVRDQIDHQRVVTENIRKDVQINHIFTEIKYSSPQFTKQLKDAVTRENDKFTFECEVTGNPEPTVEWFKDGISIQNNPDYKTTFNKGICRLVIEETFAADSARFTCRASNLVGNAETSANLSVRENAADVQMIAPRIVRFLESGKAKEGSSYEFSCVVTGNPLPTVQWYKNDKCIDDSPDYVISYNNGEAKLRFEEVFLEDDAVYTCSASNPAGIEHCSASLIVEPLEPTEMPHFKIPLTNAMARVGQKIKLEALIGGIPRPDIYWLHNGKPFYPRDIKYEYGRVTVIIPQAYPNDAGVYVLTAKNLAGEAYSSCNVIVKGRLPNETSDSEMASDMDVEPIKPSVQLALKDVSIFEGKPVRLDCVIVGQPEPEVIWYHNDRPVKESADVQLLFQGDKCSLIIQEVYQEDGGNYKVVAINSAGEASSSCELKVTPLNIAEPATRAQSERQSLAKELEPKFEKFLSDVLVDEGETVEMEVVLSGDKPMTAKWYLTNKELTTSDRFLIESNPQGGVFKLTIRNVNNDDKGVYTVKVFNNAGDAKCFSHLIVKSVNAPESQRSQQVEIVEQKTCPEFKELFSDKTVNEDDLVKFECIVKGKPTPKVHWYFNDQPVHGHNFLVSTSGDREVLTIQKVGPDTVGKISCVAENDVGKATCVAFLGLVGSGLECMPAQSNMQTMTQEHNTDSSRVTIKKQTFTTTSTSQVSSYEGNIPQTEIHHSSAHIDQSLKQLGAQRPEILESHHYQELHKSKDMSSPHVQQKSFVLVQSATNGTSSASTNAIVPSSPTRTRREIAPRFTTPLTGKIVDQGADVSMEAIYDGFPSPEIKVEKNGAQLFDTDRLKIGNKCNRVTIDLKEVNVGDAGRYAVTASNSMGQSTSTADLVVKKTIFPPVFGRRLQAQVVKKGEKIIMEVEVTGLPEPTVVWMKDEKPLNEAGLSVHRLLTQGNTHKLIIEKGQVSDSGKYMVKATNAGGEAKSIADCAVLEPTPERMQEVVKTIVYETPSEFKSETLAKEPQSFETQQSEITTSNDLHGLSESKIITEHRCTTEATMRLEHKSAYLDLPELQQRNTTNNNNTTVPTPNDIKQIPIIATTTSNNYYTTNTTTTIPNQDVTDFSKQLEQLKSLSSNFDNMKTKIGYTQTPPPVPPKPYPPVTATIVPPSNDSFNTSSTTSTMTSSNSTEKKSSSFEYFKKIDEVIKDKPVTEPNNYQKYESKPSKVEAQKPSMNLEEELKNLNLIPGSPPEICFIPNSENKANKPTVNEKIQKIEERQFSSKEPPHGGVSIFPPQTPTKAAAAAPNFTPNMPLASETYSHDTTLTKSVKVEYGQPIMRPAGTLPTPAQQFTRSPSPKPSAEGLAMSKLWTPNHVSGYESCTSEFEHHSDTKSQKHEVKEIKIQKLPTPTKELSAPFLVKQVAQNIPTPTKTRGKTPIDGIELRPGTPPEICFAGQPEQRRQSLVETMEKTLEQNLIQGGPSKVLPHSVPTITPSATSTKPTYKPPPPVVPIKLQAPRGEYYESDYESDRWKYSGSESDENSLRQSLKPHPSAFKTNGYAADTEEISSFSKMESSMMEKKSFYESSSTTNGPAPLDKQPPAQLYYTSSNASHHNGPDKQESFASQENKYHHEDKDYKVTSMTKNIAYNMSSQSSTTGPKFQSTPIKAPAAPSPIPVQRKTPAEFSDYSSEIDERFRSVSRNCESESEIKGYRVVFPPTPVPKTNGHKSPVVVVTPSPMEFESVPPKPKFEPIRQEQRHEVKTESSKQFHSYKQQQQQQQTQQVFKPKPVAAKFLAAAQQQQQQQSPPQQPQFRPQPQYQQAAQPTMYYNAIAGTPLHMAKMATETKNVMQMKESSETCQRVVNMQQTKRVIHFDSQKQESNSQMHNYGQQQQQQQLEPFPYSPTPSPRCTPARQRVPPPPTPTKFVPGDFRESDYDSEIENAKIAPLWTPMGEQGPLRFRHVEPPRPGRSCSLPRTYERVLSPMEFDRGPEMPSKIQVDVNAIRQQRGSSVNPRTQSLSRHSSMRSNQQNYQSTLYEQEQQNFSRDDMNLKVGSPPRYGYIQSQAEEQAKSMSSTFMQKSHKFVEDVKEDLQKITKTSMVNGTSTEPRVITHSFRPGFKRAPSEGDNKPQAYRDESRVSQYGTKCVDPNTGLIYFKYDFGYEFGILFPGEGHKFVANKWNSSQSSLPPTTSQQLKQTGRKSPYPLPGGRDVIIPVRHERSTTSTPTQFYGNKAGSGGYYSDTEATKQSRGPLYKTTSSNAPSFNMNRLKKRYSLPNTQVIDINIDRLHSNGSLHNLHRLPYPDPPQDVPVNAHLNRDEYPQKPPMFITPLKDRAVVAGQQARFECIVQCHPQPNVIWNKNGYDLESSNKHILEYRNGVCRLTIPQAYPDDAGTYSCTASNPLGTATTTGSLEVTGKYNAGQRY